MSHNCLLGNCWVLVSCFHPRFPLYCRGCQVRQVNRSSLQDLHSSPVVTQLCLSWGVFYLSPLMVAPLGCRRFREAPLRAGGTRGLPESGMPHLSSRIHQIWRSHCSMHTNTCHHNPFRAAYCWGFREQLYLHFAIFLLKHNYADH